jgi:hypothetical protein
MSGTPALGVINGITARWDRKEMFVFEDRLVVVSAGDMFARTMAHQFGLIGILIYNLGKKSRLAAAERRRQQPVEQLLALDPKSVQIMLRDVVDARLSAGLLTAKLSLSLVDGTRRQFSWSKGENNYDRVLGFLRAALGTKLNDEKKAA